MLIRSRFKKACDEIKLSRLTLSSSLDIVGVDPRFLKGEGVAGWYLGAAESMEHAPKMLQFEKWNLIENRFTRNTSNATK